MNKAKRPKMALNLGFRTLITPKSLVSSRGLSNPIRICNIEPIKWAKVEIIA